MSIKSLLFLLFVVSFQLIYSQIWTQKGNNLFGDMNDDEFGRALCLSGDGGTLVVGSFLNSENGINSGQVKVYQWDGNLWVQKGNNILGENDLEWLGYSVGINENGNVIIVGSPYYNINGSHAGQAKIFEWDGSSWLQKGNSIMGEVDSDIYGRSVGISAIGNIVAVGAPGVGYNGDNTGLVKIFEWDGNEWVQKGNDILVGIMDEIGYYLDLSDNGLALITGSIYYNNSSGYVKVYEWMSNDWQQKGSQLNGINEGDLFGFSLSIDSSGSNIAIGAIGDNEGGFHAGKVKVYNWNTNDWQQKGNDIIGENQYDESGSSVSLSSDGSILAIGAFQNHDVAPSAGHVRVFDWEQNSRQQNSDDIDPLFGNGWFGWALSLSSDGSSFAVSAPRNSETGVENGKVNVFSSPNLSINESLKKQAFVVYPNPSKKYLTIESYFLIDEINIYSVDGKLIINKQKINSKSIVLNINNLQNNLYYIVTKSNDKIETEIFIKE